VIEKSSSQDRRKKAGEVIVPALFWGSLVCTIYHLLSPLPIGFYVISIFYANKPLTREQT
jgi:hypothetical protein